MTQISYPWDGTTLGHAIHAPYSSDEWTSLWEHLFGCYDVEREGVLISNRTNYTGNLEVTNPAGLTLRVLSGLAMVDGTLYSNSDTVDFTAAPAGGNYIMLRKSWAAQTVRLVHNVNIGPTRSEGVTWDIVLAIVTTAGGAITAWSDERHFINNVPNIYKVQGGTGGVWGNGGDSTYHQDAFGGELQTGVTTVTFGIGEYITQTTVTFPRPYYTNNAPIVITNVVSIAGWTDTANNIYAVETGQITPHNVVIRVRRSLSTDGANTVTISWAALASMYPSRQGSY